MKIKTTKRAVAAHVTFDGNVLCDTRPHFVAIEEGHNGNHEVWFPCGGWWSLNEFHVYTAKEALNCRGKTALDRQIADRVTGQLSAAMQDRVQELGFVLVLVTKTIMPRGKRIAIL